MLLLALDTTTRPGSIALVRDAHLLASASGDAGTTHAERLPGEIVRMLTDAGVELSAIDAFGVAAGPGSFTGLRIGIATVQGLAFALNRPVVAVSCLDALARIALAEAAGSGDRAPLLAAWMDAQRSEVFAALYDPVSDVGTADVQTSGVPTADARASAVSPSDAPMSGFQVIDGPVSERPEPVLRRWQTTMTLRRIWLAGDGVDRYRDRLVEHLGHRLAIVEPLPPLAPVIAGMALRAIAAGEGGPPHAVRPIYIRRPDAELARDRQRGSAVTGSRDVQ